LGQHDGGAGFQVEILRATARRVRRVAGQHLDQPWT
jgi:hypothetical protein